MSAGGAFIMPVGRQAGAREPSHADCVSHDEEPLTEIPKIDVEESVAGGHVARTIHSEPAVIVGAIAAAFAVGAAVRRERSSAIAAGMAGLVALGQAVVTRSLVAPVGTVEDARNEGAAEMLDAVAESRLDPDMWEAIRAVPAAGVVDDDCRDCPEPAPPRPGAVSS